MRIATSSIISLFVFCFSGCAESDPNSDVPIVRAPTPPSESSVTWFSSEDSKYGLKDADGRVVLPPTYDSVSPFSEGLAAVNLGAEWMFPGVMTGGKWGYVDESGVLRIPIQYWFALSFSEGLAQVKNGEGIMFIDRTGDVKIRLDVNAGDFREGLAPVYRHRQGRDLLTEYIDERGKVVLSVQGYGGKFSEGYAVFSIPGRSVTSSDSRLYGYIDKSGATVIKPRFGGALEFSHGLAAVRSQETFVHGVENLTWGYINPSGVFVIEPEYNEARRFQDGKALVHEGGIYIDVEDGPCYWEGGTWWLIDERGKKVGRVVDPIE